MGISTHGKGRNRPILRTVQHWARHHAASASSPSQQAIESNTRDAYFWRR